MGKVPTVIELTEGDEAERTGATARQRTPADRTTDTADRLEAPSIFATAGVGFADGC